MHAPIAISSEASSNTPFCPHCAHRHHQSIGCIDRHADVKILLQDQTVSIGLRELLNLGSSRKTPTHAFIRNGRNVRRISCLAATLFCSSERFQAGYIRLIMLSDMGNIQPACRKMGAAELIDPTELCLLYLPNLEKSISGIAGSCIGPADGASGNVPRSASLI